MKKTTLFGALLCLAQSALHADVPLFINYQGKVADSTGLPIGASGTAAAPVAAPVNRKVIFRIYDAATGGTRLWTEEQTATLSLGVFSVLLGNGITATGTASTESRPALDTVFTPSTATSRFLEIMVDNGDNTINASDVPISPRQQITSTAFALHAKVADGIASGADLTINPLSGTASNYGLGWYGSGRLFDSVAVDGPVLYGNSGGALGSSASGTKKIALLWNATGQVGIGATGSFAASNKLTLQGDDAATPAQQLVIRGNTDPAERLNIGFDTTGNKATLQSYTAAATAGNLLLNPSGGNVGIGSATAPSAKLSIGDPIGGNATTLSTSLVTNAGALGTVADSELILGNFGFNANSNSSLAISAYRTTAGTTWLDTALVLGMNVDVTKRAGGGFISIHGNGNVGIGTLSPGFKLTVNGNAYVAGNLHADGDIYMKSGYRILNGDGALYLSTGTAQPTIFQNNSAETMRISPTGNVGIGTNAPGARLHVNGGSVKIQNTTYPGLDMSSGSSEMQLTVATTAGGMSGSAAVGDVVLRALTKKLHFQSGQGAAALTIDTSNNVGIGTASPAYKLDVAGNVRAGQLNLDGAIVMGDGPAIWGKNTGGVYEQVFWPRSANGTYINYGTAGFYIRNNASTNTMTMTDGGIVSIGTGTAIGKLNIGAKTASYDRYGVLYTDGASGNNNYEANVPLSIWADGYVAAPIFHVSSDSRIKTILHPTDSTKDLQTLMAMQVTDYQFKDTVTNGNRPQKKLIAQQVEKFYPEAINTTKGVVPDIFKKATVKDGWIELATDLKVGERVRLILPSGESLEEVLEVRGDAFRTSLKASAAETFVYGREVNDFRSVDYDAIAMLNVSATQEIKREKDSEMQVLDRQLKEKDAKIAVLEAKVAAQDKRSTAQDKRSTAHADEVASQNSRLVALEKLMNQAGAPETVSIKLGDP
jgi:hypothetical protein